MDGTEVNVTENGCGQWGVDEDQLMHHPLPFGHMGPEGHHLDLVGVGGGVYGGYVVVPLSGVVEVLVGGVSVGDGGGDTIPCNRGTGCRSSATTTNSMQSRKANTDIVRVCGIEEILTVSTAMAVVMTTRRTQTSYIEHARTYISLGTIPH